MTQRYQILHPHGSPQGTDIARPAEFLLDSAGTVRWVGLTESVNVRANPDQVLKAWDGIKTPPPAR